MARRDDDVVGFDQFAVVERDTHVSSDGLIDRRGARVYPSAADGGVVFEFFVQDVEQVFAVAASRREAVRIGALAGAGEPVDEVVGAVGVRAQLRRPDVHEVLAHTRAVREAGLGRGCGIDDDDVEVVARRLVREACGTEET